MRNASIVLVVFAALIAGCGGGGGGGGGGSSASSAVLPATTITESNKKQVAGTAVRGDFRSLGTFSSGAGVVPANGQKRATVKIHKIVDSVYRLGILTGAGGAQIPAGVVNSRTDPCVSGDPSKGTLTRRFDDKDGNGDFSANDTLEETFTNCFVPDDEFTISGKVTFAYRTVSGSPVLLGPPWNAVVDVLFSNVQIAASGQPTLILDGPIVWSENRPNNSQTTLNFSTAKFSVKNGGDSTILADVSITVTEDLVTGAYSEFGIETVSSSALGGSIVLEIPEAQPLQGIDPNFPSSGTIKVSGANSALTLTAIDSATVRLDLDINKDGVIDSTETVSWASLI